MRIAGVRIIGLTGGIATGKSSAARFFQRKGALVIDADELSREAVRPGSICLEQLTSAFGADVLNPDGSLDRHKLREMVFADSVRRRTLEGIIHPEIRRLAEEHIAAAVVGGHRIIFYMAPLLIEACATDRVDEIWVVTVRPEIQVERLMRRDSISRDEALRIIGSQMPLADKERCGRIVIDNSGSPEDTELILNAIWSKEVEVKNE